MNAGRRNFRHAPGVEKSVVTRPRDCRPPWAFPPLTWARSHPLTGPLLFAESGMRTCAQRSMPTASFPLTLLPLSGAGRTCPNLPRVREPVNASGGGIDRQRSSEMLSSGYKFHGNEMREHRRPQIALRAALRAEDPHEQHRPRKIRFSRRSPSTSASAKRWMRRR